MVRLALGNALTYFLTAWFVVVLALITFSGLYFLGAAAYHLIF